MTKQFTLSLKFHIEFIKISHDVLNKCESHDHIDDP
jgi:hypothetical protein